MNTIVCRSIVFKSYIDIVVGKKEKRVSSSVDRKFGRVLRDKRRERGLSQEKLGFESGYHRTYISLLERGQKSPTLRTIFRLASSLRIAPAELIQCIEDETE